MERKKGAAFASLLMILFASFTLVAPTSAPNGGSNHLYKIMGEDLQVRILDSLNNVPLDRWNFSFPSLLYSQNITFSAPDAVTGIVNLTVPYGTYVGPGYMLYDDVTNLWIRFTLLLSEDGYGWLFTGTGTSPVLGDVDCYTFNNNTGSYWNAPGDPYGFNGTLAAAPGQLPSPGPDGVAGTSDDGFGDGTPDPIGSSILYLPATINAEYHGGEGVGWTLLFNVPWSQIFTTGTAYDIVIEPESMIDGANLTEVGEPWEFLAGIQHPPAVSYGHAKWNAYVTYVCVWSMLDISTTLGPYDSVYAIRERKVREDVVIADINGDEIVDIFDIVICAAAFGSRDPGYSEAVAFGPDKKPYSPPPAPGDDKIERDPNYDNRADLMDERGLIDIFDLVKIAGDFGAKLTKDCIIRP